MRQELIYVPNIIGYLRIALLMLFVIEKNPIHKCIYISISLLLDVLDGKVARYLQQTTLFGARLDLIIDMLSLGILGCYAALCTRNIWLSSLLLLGVLNDVVNYTLTIFTFYRRKESLSSHKQSLIQTGVFLPHYYNPFKLGLSNILNDVFLILFLYCPFPAFIFYICSIGYCFRQLALLEQAYFLIFQIGKKTRA